jgi:U4/U6.U5 tri-snRNP-associated protein 2
MQNLDFDFEKCCSVSLSRVNIYACLVCGAYFQGRGPGTHAHTHSVEDGHHLFMNLSNGRVFCIPDNYEVVDRSLKDIQHVLNPMYSRAEIAAVGSLSWARTLDGADYMPGLVGLNNMKRNDYLNVVLQALLRVPALRCVAYLPPQRVGPGAQQRNHASTALGGAGFVPGWVGLTNTKRHD